MNDVIVDVAPQSYVRQGASHCGAFAVKGVLSAFGLDHSDHASELHIHPLSKYTGSAVSADYYPSILRMHGLSAKAASASNLSDSQRLNLIKSEIDRGCPVIVQVANHFDRQSGAWDPFKGIIASHWFSIWGYNDDEACFYTYDSLISEKLVDGDVPVGNKRRSFSTFLQIWVGSQLSRRVFGTHSWIQVERPESKRAPSR